MDLSRLGAALAQSRKVGHIHRGLKVLNVVNTARGAITTVLLAASAVGGATVVQQAASREAANPDRADRGAVARPTPRVSASPARSPLTSAMIRADAERRLQVALQQQAAAVDELRKVSVLSPARIDQLVADTRTRLQQRADLAMLQIVALAGGAVPTAGSETNALPVPSPSFNVITLNSLVQIAVADMNGIVFQATRVATTAPTPPPPTRPPTVPPTSQPTPRPTTPPPATRTPIHSPSPSPSR